MKNLIASAAVVSACTWGLVLAVAPSAAQAAVRTPSFQVVAKLRAIDLRRQEAVQTGTADVSTEAANRLEEVSKALNPHLKPATASEVQAAAQTPAFHDAMKEQGEIEFAEAP